MIQVDRVTRPSGMSTRHIETAYSGKVARRAKLHVYLEFQITITLILVGLQALIKITKLTQFASWLVFSKCDSNENCVTIMINKRNIFNFGHHPSVLYIELDGIHCDIR